MLWRIAFPIAITIAITHTITTTLNIIITISIAITYSDSTVLLSSASPLKLIAKPEHLTLVSL